MATQTSKAKRIDALPKKPTVARAEVIDKATRGRFEAELDAALKRKPASEVKLAGALRAVAASSPALRSTLVDAAQIMVKRGSYARELYAATVRTLAEADDRHVPALLKTALASEDCGGSATLSAVCFSRDPSLAVPLGKLAASRQSHVAFGAETARVCRRESNGAHLRAIAPMIKESHRIALCVEVFLPLTRGAPVPINIGPALAVLRDAERHLGRWLVLAEVSAKAGDDGPRQEAVQKAQIGPASARAAWSLATWALSETRAALYGDEPVAAPSTRPTVELIARLSDRPSADRDTTFLFRMARARATSAKAMLEALVKTLPLTDELGVRAASFLARDHGREDLREALLDCARTAKRDDLRGMAVAALWDSGSGPTRAATREMARHLADELAVSRCISSVAWGALVRAAHASHRDAEHVVVREAALRWIHRGWLE